MALTIEVRVNGRTDIAGRYVTWAPSPCELRVTDAGGAATPIGLLSPSPTAALQYKVL
jgi:hypothetical protein